jgi:hypothetical protein
MSVVTGLSQLDDKRKRVHCTDQVTARFSTARCSVATARCQHFVCLQRNSVRSRQQCVVILQHRNALVGERWGRRNNQPEVLGSPVCDSVRSVRESDACQRGRYKHICRFAARGSSLRESPPRQRYLSPNTAMPVCVGTKTLPATTVGELNKFACPKLSRPFAAWVLLYSCVARLVAS